MILTMISFTEDVQGNNDLCVWVCVYKEEQLGILHKDLNLEIGFMRKQYNKNNMDISQLAGVGGWILWVNYIV